MYSIYLEILLSLDMEKTFDGFEWDFLFSTMSKFGFGAGFISMIKLLCAHLQASVQTNNVFKLFLS